MGRSRLVDIVKNVAAIGNIASLHPVGNEDFEQPINGWTSIECDTYPGKKNSLYPSKLTKDGQEVYIVNSDEYADVGEYSYVVFSDDRSAVEAFLIDFGIEDVEIEDMDAVCQTL